MHLYFNAFNGVNFIPFNRGFPSTSISSNFPNFYPSGDTSYPSIDTLKLEPEPPIRFLTAFYAFFLSAIIGFPSPKQISSKPHKILPLIM